VTRLQAGTVRGSNPGTMKKSFFFPHIVQTALGFTQRVQWAPEVSLSGGGRKPPGRGVHHSPLSKAEVKNVWRYTSTPPISLHSVAGGNMLLIIKVNVILGQAMKAQKGSRSINLLFL
jgi:hypothetical protein